MASSGDAQFLIADPRAVRVVLVDRAQVWERPDNRWPAGGRCIPPVRSPAVPVVQADRAVVRAWARVPDSVPALALGSVQAWAALRRCRLRVRRPAPSVQARREAGDASNTRR